MALIRQKLPRSVRRHIRRQKAAIRRAVGGEAEQAQKIKELYARYGVVMD